MTYLEVKEHILSTIAERGWYYLGVYGDACRELKAEGLIKLGSHKFEGREPGEYMVWVAA